MQHKMFTKYPALGQRPMETLVNVEADNRNNQFKM